MLGSDLPPDDRMAAAFVVLGAIIVFSLIRASPGRAVVIILIAVATGSAAMMAMIYWCAQRASRWVRARATVNRVDSVH